LIILLTSCVSAPEKQTDVEQTASEPEKIEESENPLSFYNGPEDVEKALKVMEDMENDKMDRDSRFIYYSLLISSNEIDKAIEQLKILLSENENDIESLIAFIAIMDYSGDTEQRDISLNKLIEIDADNSFAHNMRGSLALRDKNYAKAEISFLKSLQADPGNVDSYIGRGNSLMHIEGREEESVSSFDAAEKIDPDNPYIYSDRSRVLRFLKDYGRAEDDMSKAISLFPSEWNYLDRARIRLADLDDKAGAKEDLNQILLQNNSNFFANVYLAGIYDEEKEYDLALDF